MKVCIAEKPSVAKEIAQILGASTRKDGYYEGNGYQITWTFGHLCTLKEPNDYEPGLKRWSLFSLPIIPQKFGIKTIPDQGIERQFKTITRLVQQAEEVINCGDAGQEGELIQRWVLQKAQCNAPVKRLWISSLTEEAIRDGFNKLKPASDFDRLYYAGSSRAVGDWLLGINATRLFTLKYGQGGNVLSIGRVQTPTLAMIVERFKEIESFVPVPFWEVKTNYRDVVFNSALGKLPNKEDAEKALLDLQQHPFVVDSFTQKEGKENAPKLFDLTSLQVECNKKHNLSAENTLKIAQKLYEGKYITYPRVDTRFLPDDIFPSIPGILKSMTTYSELTQVIIKEPIKKSKLVFNNTKVTDHHAIIPTNIAPTKLSENEHQVYDIIAKRFIANFYPECTVSKTQVIGNVNETEFKASGKEILNPGWRVVYGAEEPDEDDNANKDKEDSQLLPNFTEGETGPHSPLYEEKITSPPKLYTEGTLLRAMETAGKQVQDEDLRELMKENGIGRPSTRANIIETLFRRKYIAKQKKNIVPTLTGIQLIDTINIDLLKSAALTGNWEQKLRKIENGEYEVATFMQELKEMVYNLVHEVKNQSIAQKIAIEEKPLTVPKITKNQVIACPKCKEGELLTGKTAYGCSNFNQGCDFRIPLDVRGKKISPAILKTLVSTNKSKLIKGVPTKDGKKDGYLTLDATFTLGFVEHENEPLICPACKKGTIVKGQRAYGCNAFKNGCRFTIPFTLNDKTFTEKQIEQLVLKGKTGKLKANVNNEEKSGYFSLNQEFKVEFTEG